MLAAALPALAQDGDDKVVIQYWDWWVTQAGAVDQAIEEFEAANPNIDVVKTTHGGGPYQEMLNLAFQSETPPDVFMLPSGDAEFANMLASDWLMSFNQFDDVEDFVTSFPNPKMNFIEGINIVDGKLYSAPFSTAKPWLQLYVNTKLYEDAGLVNEDGSLMLPNTWEEMIENSRVITEKTDAYGTGFSMVQNWAAGWWWNVCWFSGGGSNWDFRTGEYVYSKVDCYKKVAEDLLMMRDEGLIHPQSLAFAIDDEGARVLFAEHEFAHLVGGEWVINGWANTHPDFTEYTAIRFPLVGVEEPTSFMCVGPPAGRWFGVSSMTENPEEAWEFFKWINSERWGEIWATDGNGLHILTPGDPADYATNEAWENIFSMGSDVRVCPQPNMLHPDLAEVQTTLIGPAPNDVFVGILSGQIEDIDAALADLDQRLLDARLQGIEDAKNAGLDVDLEYYIFEDWNPLEDWEIPDTLASGVDALE
jgi:ABC-type glycerol-3-phosphate transport system substrate-binding protein